METQTEKNTPYWKQRVGELGLTEEQNTVKVWMPQGKEPATKKLLFFNSKKEDDLTILYLDVKKREDAYVAMSYRTKIVHESGVETQQDVPYVNTRLKKPIGKNKYKLPAGAPAMPYFTRKVIDAMNSTEKVVIPVLVLVEGSLKAEKGAMHDMYCIGINGIFGTRDKKKKELHYLIKKVLEQCTVKNIVYLQDADAREVKIEYLKDLGERPKNFADAVNAFKKACRYLKDRPNCYYAHVREDIGAKGLDDVLIANRGNEHEVFLDLHNLAAAKNFFVVKDLDRDFKDLRNIQDYFNISSPEQFYNANSDKLGEDQYLFLGDQYKYDDDSETLELVVPGIVNDYVYVGNRYAKLFYIPNSKGHAEPDRDVRNRETIIDDFLRMGKSKKEAEDLILKIPKYDAFCNEPNFLEFEKEKIVNGRFKLMNLAYPIEHVPQEGEFPNIMKFLEHIFWNGGDSKLSVGMDMIQMYYTRPCQIQRILCLVSRENETGKTTFLEFLKAIFGQNMSIIGNQDFKSQFNPYIVKSLVGIDESRIDDMGTIEMIKSMVTNAYANFNDKMVSARPVVNRAKLIMTTNHIFDFANIGESENKWFVLEVSKLQHRDKDMVEKMMDEIPAFLHYLRHRELQHFTTESRFAIPDDVVETEALKRVKESSTHPLLRMIREYVQTRFLDHGEQQFQMDALRLYENIFPERSNKYSKDEIKMVLNREMNMFTTDITAYFSYPTVEESVMDEMPEPGLVPEMKVKWVGKSGKVFTFIREQWLNEK